MKRIGIISDTHGSFDDDLREFLSGVDEIWHAGDIGTIELADQIAAFKPLRAVYGNIDGGKTRVEFRDFLSFYCEDVKVLLTHIGGLPGRYDQRAYGELMRERPAMFVCGHSHILRVGYDKQHKLLHINPGAAGRSGVHYFRTAVRLVIDGAQIRDLEVSEWKR